MLQVACDFWTPDFGSRGVQVVKPGPRVQRRGMALRVTWWLMVGVGAVNETSIEVVLVPIISSYRFILSSGNHLQLQPELNTHIFAMCVKMKAEIDFITGFFLSFSRLVIFVTSVDL